MKSKKHRGPKYVGKLMRLAETAYRKYRFTICIDDDRGYENGKFLVVNSNEQETGQLILTRPERDPTRPQYDKDILFRTDNIDELEQWLDGVGMGRTIGTQDVFGKFFNQEVNNNRRAHVRFLFDKNREILGHFTFSIGDVETDISFVKDISSHGVRFAIPMTDMLLYEVGGKLGGEDNDCRITYTEKSEGKEVRVSVDGKVAWFKSNGTDKRYQIGIEFELRSVQSPVQRSCFLTILKKYVNPETEYER